MNKYEITTNKKKQSIVNTASALFKVNGFTNVSIKEIASRSHVSQVTIYNYFGNKETLVEECVKIIISDTLQYATDILAKDISFDKKLKLALTLCTDKINLAIWNFFTQDALSDSTLVELLIKNVNESKKKIYREYIELGKQEKVIDSTIPTETFLYFMEALNVIGSKWKIDDETPEKIRQIHRLFLYGIMGKE